MSPTRSFFLAALVVALVLPLGSALSSPIPDGFLDAGFYGAPLVVQDTPTAFGDSQLGHPRVSNDGSELDAAFARVEADTLYLLFTGNLETGTQGLDWFGGVRNRLDIFFDSFPGGQNQLRGDNAVIDNDALNRMGYLNATDPGLRFDAGFEADVYMAVSNYTEVVATPDPQHPYGEAWRGNLVHATLPTAGGGTGQSLGVAEDILPGYYTATFSLGMGVRFGFRNDNAGGVTGTGDASPSVVDAPNVTTGIELAVPLNALRDSTGALATEIKVCAFVNSPTHDFLSNQMLAPLSQPSGSEGNLGEPRVTDLQSIPGDQYFVVPVSVLAVGDGGATGSTRLPRARPNPFRSRTAVRFDLPAAGPVSARVFDVRGRVVAELFHGRREAGPFEVAWSPERGAVSPGIYFINLKMSGVSHAVKVVLTP